MLPPGLMPGISTARNCALGEAAAIVLDGDQYAISLRISVQFDRGSGQGEFERILQKVPDCRKKHIPVGLDCKRRINEPDA